MGFPDCLIQSPQFTDEKLRQRVKKWYIRFTQLLVVELGSESVSSGLTEWLRMPGSD